MYYNIQSTQKTTACGFGRLLPPSACHMFKGRSAALPPPKKKKELGICGFADAIPVTLLLFNVDLLKYSEDISAAVIKCNNYRCYYSHQKP